MPSLPSLSLHLSLSPSLRLLLCKALLHYNDRFDERVCTRQMIMITRPERNTTTTTRMTMKNSCTHEVSRLRIRSPRVSSSGSSRLAGTDRDRVNRQPEASGRRPPLSLHLSLSLSLPASLVIQMNGNAIAKFTIQPCIRENSLHAHRLSRGLVLPSGTSCLRSLAHSLTRTQASLALSHPFRSGSEWQARHLNQAAALQ